MDAFLASAFRNYLKTVPVAYQKLPSGLTATDVAISQGLLDSESVDGLLSCDRRASVAPVDVSNLAPEDFWSKIRKPMISYDVFSGAILPARLADLEEWFVFRW